MSAALAVLAVVLWLAPNALAQQDIHSSGPLSDIWIGDDLSCQVVHAGVGSGDFYGGNTDGPASCGTVLSLTGDNSGVGSYGVFGSAEDFTSVTAPTLTGTGTEADPYVVTTEVSAGSTGVKVIETDSYVVGQDYYRTAIEVTNGSDNSWAGSVYHAGDCYLNGNDSSYGFIDTNNNGIACSQSSDSPSDGLMEFQDLTGGSNFYEGHYYTAEGALTPRPSTRTRATVQPTRTLAWGSTGTSTFRPASRPPSRFSPRSQRRSPPPAATRSPAARRAR